MAAKSKKSILDALVDEDSSDSDAEKTGDEGEEEEAVTKRSKKALSLEDLERAGFKGGPSVLLMKAPEENQANFGNWCVSWACMHVLNMDIRAWAHGLKAVSVAWSSGPQPHICRGL